MILIWLSPYLPFNHLSWYGVGVPVLPEVSSEVFFEYHYELKVVLIWCLLTFTFSFSFFVIYIFKGLDALKHTLNCMCMSQVSVSSIFVIIHFSAFSNFHGHFFSGNFEWLIHIFHNFKYVGDFLLPISNLTAVWSAHMLWNFISLKFLRFILLPGIWPDLMFMLLTWWYFCFQILNHSVFLLNFCLWC